MERTFWRPITKLPCKRRLVRWQRFLTGGGQYKGFFTKNYFYGWRLSLSRKIIASSPFSLREMNSFRNSLYFHCWNGVLYQGWCIFRRSQSSIVNFLLSAECCFPKAKHALLDAKLGFQLFLLHASISCFFSSSIETELDSSTPDMMIFNFLLSFSSTALLWCHSDSMLKTKNLT